MELIQIYTANTGLENILTLLALLVFIIGIVSISIVCAEAESLKIKLGVAISIVIVFVTIIVINCNLEPINVYTYNVKDANILEQKLESEYKIYQKNGQLYDLIKK